MRFSRQATTAAVASSSTVQLVLTFFIAAAAIESSPVVASRTNELVSGGDVDSGILMPPPSLRSSSISSSHGLGGGAGKHIGGVLVGGGGGREVEGICGPSSYINCVNGMVDTDPDTSSSLITCSEACLPDTNYSASTLSLCGIGTDACSGTTAKICKDADSPSCSGKNACKKATIPYIVKSCKGDSACESVRYVGGGAAANTVGNFTNSCHASKACFKAAYGGEGGLEDLENSCTADQACQALGAGMFGLVTSDLTDCCAIPHKCSGYSEAILPVQCKVGVVMVS